MPEYRLPRSGDAPLLVTGELVAESDGERIAGKEQNRWHELAVYHLEDGRYALAVNYRTRWQGELGHDLAVIVPDAAGVRRALKEYSPLAQLVGFPAGEHYAERQARLEADIRRRYDAQVSDLLDREEFAESAAESEGVLYDRWQIAIYRQLLAIGLREADWTQEEASLICDALNGTYLLDVGFVCDKPGEESGPHSWRWWPANVEDAIRLERLDAKWGVDKQALLGKIKRLSALGLAAVADAAERFWRLHTQEETGAALRKVGLLR
jgi:hypothetical protein